MAKVEIDVDVIQDNSLENSADSEYLGMVEEDPFRVDDKSHLVAQPFLNAGDSSETYNFRELPNSVTYKLVHMTGAEDTTATMASHSPSHEYYVISNPVEVFGAPAAQKKVKISRDPHQAKAVTAKKRDDKRRATHNEVERRRRDKINSWITKLAALVPNSGLPDSASKGGILAKACDHITDLTQKQKKLEKLEVENEKLVLEIIRLNQELTDVRKENNSMRNQLADTCIVTTQRAKGQKS